MSYIKKIKLPNNPTPYDIYDEGAARKEDLTTIKTEVKSEILGSAPEELNTLEELAKALGQDENFSTTVLNMIGQKQDWNQNNSEAIDYIKNRTHWVEQGFEELLPETTLSLPASEDGHGYGELTELDGVEFYTDEYLTLSITFDGVRYTCERYNSSNVAAWGDSRLIYPSDTTGPSNDPFVIDCWYDEAMLTQSIPKWSIAVREAGTHTIKIEIPSGETIHTLDEKFIPKSIARTSDLENIDLSGFATIEQLNQKTQVQIITWGADD